MTRILRDEDIRALIRFPDAVDALAAALSTPAETARMRVALPEGWYRIMAGTLPDADVFGCKAFHLVSDTVRYLLALYRLSTGEPLALLDAKYLTVARTSATAAAAARRYWGEEPFALAIVGAGAQASDGLRALASVCDIRGARVYSPTAERRVRYASALGAELEIEIEPVASAADAVRGAAMVLCATQTGGEIALAADDVGAEVRYVSSISSTLPAQRELDGALFARASTVVVDTRDALEESGDLRSGGVTDAQLLSDYLEHGARDTAGIVVYSSIGSFEQDLALAAAVAAAAELGGIGTTVAEIETPKSLARAEPRA